MGIYAENESDGLSTEQIRSCLEQSLQGQRFKKVLLVPPDITRLNSGAGLITGIYYRLLRNARVDVLPALGTHAPMTRQEQIDFYGSDIPPDRFLTHDWRVNVQKIGEIPNEFIREASEGLIDEMMEVEVSGYLLDSSYDRIISIGQVVPHEVAGMANYTKNIVVGCGGSRFINQSHKLGAFYGLERIMGKDHSPVRKVFDYAQEQFISKLNIEYVLTVTVAKRTGTNIIGLYIDESREGFERAVSLSRKHNLTRVDKPIKTCVVWLNEKEYHSTWLGNKAIYRTRMAMADGGDLMIIAPGISRFGEDASIDRLIRKYGYIGRENILALSKDKAELKENMSAAAHLIHGSSDGRFNITYATRKLSKEEIEGVGFGYMPYDEAVQMYNPEKLKAGANITKNGDELFFIEDPAAGLWTV